MNTTRVRKQIIIIETRETTSIFVLDRVVTPILCESL